MRLLAIAVVTLATAAAYAKSNTEYYFQPAASQSAVELKYDMDSMPKDGVKLTRNDIWLRYLYGLSETNTLGIYLASGESKSDATDAVKASGMTDLHPFWEAYSDMWHYGVDLGISTAKYKATTRASGGMSLAAHIGMLMSSNAWNYGADLRYTMPMERSYDDAAGTKVTGGSTPRIAGFTEYNYGMGFVGAELSYAMVGDTTTKVGAAESKEKGESDMGLALNGSYDINDMWTGLLTIASITHPEHDVSDVPAAGKVKAFTETDVQLGVRATF